MELFETIVGSTNIILLGTAHGDRMDSDAVYSALADASPSLVYVELESNMSLKTHAQNQNDLEGIHRYVQERGAEVRKYDIKPEKSFLEHHLNASDEYTDRIEAADGQAEKRRATAQHHPEMFDDLYASREDHAATELTGGIYNSPHDSIAIHAGVRHFGPLRNLLSFLA